VAVKKRQAEHVQIAEAAINKHARTKVDVQLLKMGASITSKRERPD
jgi:hypothetical protein